MTVTNNNRNNRNILGFFRRGERWREIPPGYRTGDIHSDIPIAILPESSVMGNVFAPKILVEGMLYGSAVALEVTIEAGGQIWGDVHSGRLQVEPGGKLQGWVSNLDADAYESIQVAGLIPDEIDDHTIEFSQLPAEVEIGRLARNGEQVDVLRRLQMESAAALAARDELERAFDKRLSETAGEATARAASLHEELSKLRLELTALREERDESREELRERTAQVERQANEIIMARDLLTERTEEFESLQQQHTTTLEELADLLQAKNSLDHEMVAANKQVDVLTDRLRSIESALQNSLQHASEQEESLIRWQELAEVTEGKVETLQLEVANLKFQATENNRLNEMLRAQRKQAEDAWQTAQEELAQLRQKDTMRLVPPEVMVELETQISELKTTLAQAEESRQALSDQMAKMQTQHEAQLTQLRGQYEGAVVQAQQEAVTAKEELQRNKELMLWDKATLDTTQTALEQAQDELAETQAAVTQLNTQLKTQQAEVERLQAVESDLAAEVQVKTAELAEAQDLLAARGLELSVVQEKFGEQETAVTQLHQELAKFQEKMKQLTQEIEAGKKQYAQAQEEAMLEASELRERLRETKTQLEAQEAETEDYYQQMQDQGGRLAEIQATLIEREIALTALQQTVDKQKALIDRIKNVTTERMDKLNHELSKTREQLKQAIAMVHKLRGSN